MPVPAALSCGLESQVHDVVQTGTPEGHTFIKLDAGMTEVRGRTPLFPHSCLSLSIHLPLSPSLPPPLLSYSHLTNTRRCSGPACTARSTPSSSSPATRPARPSARSESTPTAPVRVTVQVALSSIRVTLSESLFPTRHSVRTAVAVAAVRRGVALARRWALFRYDGGSLAGSSASRTQARARASTRTRTRTRLSRTRRDGCGRPGGRYVVCGHCCESGDLLSPAPGEPETLSERLLAAAAPGDLVVVEGSGAYCSGMCTKNYNSFPEAPEVHGRPPRTPRRRACVCV